MKIRKDVIDLCFTALSQGDSPEVNVELARLKQEAVDYLRTCISVAVNEVRQESVPAFMPLNLSSGDILVRADGRRFVAQPYDNVPPPPTVIDSGLGSIAGTIGGLSAR